MKITPRGKGKTRWGWFSHALAFRSLCYPWEKIGTTRSLTRLQLKAELFNSTDWNGKGDRKRGIGEKSHSPFWKNFHLLFVSHGYRCSRQLVSSGSVKNMSKKGLFFSIIFSSTPEAVDWVSFVSVLVMYSLLGLRFYLHDFFSLGQFFTTFMPHTGGGGGGGGGVWINNNYRVLIDNNLNAKKIQYSVASSHILLCHTDHYNV